MKLIPEHDDAMCKNILLSVQLLHFSFISFPHCMPVGLPADTEKQVKYNDLIGKEYQATSLSH